MVDRFQLVLLHQTQCGQPEESMEHVCLVAGAVRDTTTTAVRLQVLAVEDVASQVVEIDPLLALDHEAGAKDPPRVAHVSQFIGAAIEASLYGLSLAEPHSKLVPVDKILITQDLQGAYRSENVRCVTLSAGHASESSIDIFAR